MRSIVPLTPAHREGVLGLFAEIFGSTKAGYLRRRFDWQYRGSPALQPSQVSNWVFLDDDRVVGHLGAVMVELKVGDSIHQGCWCTDLMVHPDYRHGKDSLKLIATPDEATEVPMGYGMADVVGRIYERRGYVRHAIGSHLIRFTSLAGALNLACRPEVADRRAGRLAATLKWKGRNLRCLLNRARRPIPAAPDGWSVEISADPPPVAGALWQTVASDYPVAVSRSEAQLRWRYCDGQDPARFLTLLRHDEPVAVAVLETFTWSDIRVGQISELITARSQMTTVLPIALHFISGVFSRQGVDALLVEGFPADMRAQFTRHGFDEAVPGRSEIHVVLNRDDRLPAEVIGPADNWLLTAGDSDRSTAYPRLEWRV